MRLEDRILEHKGKIALQFSGGRDSLALLLALKAYWNDLTVYFLNSGDIYPETRALVDAVKGVVPNFVEVQSDVHAVHKQYGYPSDVLQSGVNWPNAERDIAGFVRLVDRHTCCFKTVMEPMHARMKQDGITLILRGQRLEDTTKSHVQDGQCIDGVTICYPLNHWTTEQVENFITQCGVPIPPFYKAGATSCSDCMHCTAWLEHNSLPYLIENHPNQAKEVGRRLRAINIAVRPFIAQMDLALEKLDGR